jgi:UDP-glucose 4-epimerase
MLRDIGPADGIEVLALRYFNVIGCDPLFRTGPYEHDRSDVLGLLLEAMSDGRPFVVNGADWPTSDGTPVRDFVHVWDVAQAHLRAARRWPTGGGFEVMNIGTGHPTTVKQLVAAAGEVSGGCPDVVTGDRRPGDIAGSCADASRAFSSLGWRAERSVRSAVADAVRWAELRRAGITSRAAQDNGGR